MAPETKIGLAEQTTTITYSEVPFADSASLWLPREVNVNIQFTEYLAGGASESTSRVTEQTFRNIHRYSNYLLYRVSTKIGAAY